jgi:hypothetical protein
MKVVLESVRMKFRSRGLRDNKGSAHPTRGEVRRIMVVVVWITNRGTGLRATGVLQVNVWILMAKGVVRI